MPKTITVRIARNQDHGMWHIEDSNLVGLMAEDGSLQELVDGLPDRVITLLATSGRDGDTDLSQLAIELRTETNLGSISVWIDVGQGASHPRVIAHE